MYFLKLVTLIQKEKCKERKEKIFDLNSHLNKKRDQIYNYQLKYNDVDLDALHERNQYLQTRNF